MTADLMNLCAVLTVALLACSLRHTAGVQTHSQAMMYLSQYGYLSPSMKNLNSSDIMSEKSMTRALMEFQSFAGLNLTGHLDDDTLHFMSMPRCGVRDKVGFATDSRSRRYALQDSRWRVKDLTYMISKYPKLLNKSDTDSEVRKAFDVWSDVTPLTFTHKKSGQVDIEISFEKGEHDDGGSFDGPGGTLAHAFFPMYGGDVHFDDSEKWSIGTINGINLFQVAAHEFGHSLGLDHSEVQSAAMTPFYRGYDPSFNLDSDDVKAIQALYGASTSAEEASDSDDDSTSQGSGKKTTTQEPPDSDDDSTSQGLGKKTTTQEPPSTDGSDAELCNDTKVDTLFNSAAGETFVFKGDYYWRLTDDGLTQGFPKSIASMWFGLPGNIDAAFTYKNVKTYFFKGPKYWRYTGTTMDDGYPKDIANGFAGIPDNVDDAIVWSGNKKIYFFKGSKFWKFEGTKKRPVMSTYPKPISKSWKGIPDNIDAALHYTNGYTYFFKDENYYRFNDKTNKVDTTDPPFPRNTGYWMFSCRAEIKEHHQEVTVAPSQLKSRLLEVRPDRKGTQNPDIGDLILDAAV